MKRVLFASALAAGTLLALGTGWAAAQAPYSRPTYSPYLNLLRPGNPAINYYGLVRPQIETQNALQQLQEQYQARPAPAQAEDQAGLPPTGHVGRFLSYGGYFLNMGGGANPQASRQFIASPFVTKPGLAASRLNTPAGTGTAPYRR